MANLFNADGTDKEDDEDINEQNIHTFLGRYMNQKFDEKKKGFKMESQKPGLPHNHNSKSASDLRTTNISQQDKLAGLAIRE